MRRARAGLSLTTAAALRARSGLRWALASVLGLCYAPSGHAELPRACEKLGDALVEHSCFHAELGPFTQLSADSGVSNAETAPRVDPVHTYYDVVLPNPLGENTVSYQVAAGSRAGSWAIFHHPEIPLRVIDERGALLNAVLEVDTPTCEALPHASVYELQAERYRLVLGPTTTTHGLLVIENVGDFVVFGGIDRDGDGYGDPRETIKTPCLPPAGYAANDQDCDDNDPTVHPGAVERCDGSDQNCNGLANDVGLPCDLGQGRCKSRGRMACSSDTASCEAESITPEAETCNGLDEDCDGVDDLDEVGLCDGEVDAPRCVRVLGEVRCGCDSDADCGTQESGRVCDLETRRCAAGCVAVAGRNGCAPPQICTSADPAHTGRCTILEQPTAPAARSSGSGCGCRVSERASHRHEAATVMAFVAAMALLRRRRSVSQ